MPTPDDYNNNQPGLLQRGPTSLLPPIPPPPRNDNDPTKTQEAAVPRVPPPTPREARAPTPGDARPPAPYTPVPWHAQQPPPAPPAPPLGNWTDDQIAPWLHPHIPNIPGSLVPDRAPDGYKGPQPVYNLRPGEPGYTVGGNSNLLTGAVSWLESRNNGPFGDPSTLGQKKAFIAQYGPGPQGVTNYAQQLLRANPNATFGDFYAGYALGTGDPRRAPTIDDLRTRYPEAYRNLTNNFPSGALPGTPSGPQGPWTQGNLEANFAERTGQLGQPGNIPLTIVKAPNGQSWQVNQRVAPQFEGFLNDLYKAGYTGMVSSGGYANRPIRGGTIPSEHAYGAAIDINATANPLQYASTGGALKTDLPSNVGEIAAKWGLKWGGTFRDRQDPMHFEVAALMTPEQLQAARNGAVAPPTPGTRATGLSINTPLASMLGSTVAAPPQQYMPPPGREPQHWGQTPEHDWTPGRMPQAHDIPNIMAGLLPLALTLFAGFAVGGGLGAVAAFSGYQNARNKGQQEAAKEQKTLWQDRLKETESALKEELLESSGLMAEYGGDITSPAAKAAWSELAAKYTDRQLQAALESGNSAAIQELFKKRDEAFQTLSKTSAASTKAEEQDEQKREDQSTLNKMGFPGTGGGGGDGSAPGATPAAARGPEKPWENLGPGFAGGGGPAGVPAPGEGGRPQPAAAPPPSSAEPTPSPDESPPQAPAAAPGPEAPAPAAPPGDTTLSDVRVSAPEPTPVAAPAPPPASPRSSFDQMVSEGVNGEDIEKFKTGVPKAGLPVLQDAINKKNAQIEAVQPGPNAAAQLKAIDPTFGDYVEGVSRYTAQLPSPRANTGRAFADRVQAAAKKINPQWNFANYKKQEEFADPKGSVQLRLTRASTMGEATVNGMKALKVLQDAGVEVDQDKISEAIDRAVNGLGGDPRYMAVANAILAFTQEDQALRTGNPSVTETEAQQALVAGHIFLGSIESIRTYFQQNIDTADAAITHYQGQWKQMQGYGDMPGTDPDADAIISSMKYLEPKTGQYHMPKGTQLPPGLASAIPEHAPPPTILPKPGTTAPPAPAPTSGEVIQNGWRYDAKTHQPLGPAQ